MEDIELQNIQELQNLLGEEDASHSKNQIKKTTQIEGYKQRVFDLAIHFVETQPKSLLIPLIAHDLSKAYEIALFDESADIAIKIKKLLLQIIKTQCNYDESSLKEYCAEFLTYMLKKSAKDSECYKIALFYFMKLLLSNGLSSNLDFVVLIWKKVK